MRQRLRGGTALAVWHHPLACRKIQRCHRVLLAKLRRRVFQVEAGTERTACTPQHRGRLGFIAIESKQCLGERLRARGIHRVARLDPAADNRSDGAVTLDGEGHRSLLSRSWRIWRFSVVMVVVIVAMMMIMRVAIMRCARSIRAAFG